MITRKVIPLEDVRELITLTIERAYECCENEKTLEWTIETVMQQFENSVKVCKRETVVVKVLK